MGLPLNLRFRTRGSWPSTSARTSPPTGSGWTSTAGTRCTATARSCASTSRPRARRTCCGCRRTSPSPHGRHEADLRGGGPGAAEAQAALGGPLRGQRLQGRALVCLGLARHRVGAPSPAGPPPPQDRRAGLSLLLRADGQLLTKTRLIRAAGLRWPVEEFFEFSKDCFGLDQSQARLYTAITRTRLVWPRWHRDPRGLGVVPSRLCLWVSRASSG